MLIGANWKMHKTVHESVDFFRALAADILLDLDVEVFICVPFTALWALSQASAAAGGWPIALGAQNVFWEDEGPYTGEVSPVMLRDSGCKYAIVGHSERRQKFSETAAHTAKKVAALLRNRVRPVLCIGETWEEKAKGITEQVLVRQLEPVFPMLRTEDLPECVFAYEPVWAIGTGRRASACQAAEAHRFIRLLLHDRFGVEAGERAKILYGGSVTEKNLSELLEIDELDGVFVGGASLEVQSFSTIIRRCAQRGTEGS